MDEFMIDMQELQENVLRLQTEYRRLRLEKEQFEQETERSKAKIEDNKTTLKARKKELEEQLKKTKKELDSIKNPIKRQEDERNNTIITLQNEIQGVDTASNQVEVEESGLTQHTSRRRDEISATEKDLTERLQTFISSKLSEIKEMKQKNEQEARSDTIDKLQEQKSELLGKLQEQEKRMKEVGERAGTSDSIYLNFKNTIIPKINAQIAEIDQELENKDHQRLSENWESLDKLESIFKKIQIQPQQSSKKPSRRQQKRSQKPSKMTTYEIIDKLDKMQAIIDEIDPELKKQVKESLLSDSMKEEKAKWEEAKKVAKATRASKEEKKAKWEQDKEAAKAAKAEREAKAQAETDANTKAEADAKAKAEADAKAKVDEGKEEPPKQEEPPKEQADEEAKIQQTENAKKFNAASPELTEAILWMLTEHEGSKMYFSELEDHLEDELEINDSSTILNVWDELKTMGVLSEENDILWSKEQFEGIRAEAEELRNAEEAAKAQQTENAKKFNAATPLAVDAIAWLFEEYNHKGKLSFDDMENHIRDEWGENISSGYVINELVNMGVISSTGEIKWSKEQFENIRIEAVELSKAEKEQGNAENVNTQQEDVAERYRGGWRSNYEDWLNDEDLNEYSFLNTRHFAEKEKSTKKPTILQRISKALMTSLTAVGALGYAIASLISGRGPKTPAITSGKTNLDAVIESEKEAKKNRHQEFAEEMTKGAPTTRTQYETALERYFKEFDNDKAKSTDDKEKLYEEAIKNAQKVAKETSTGNTSKGDGDFLDLS